MGHGEQQPHFDKEEATSRMVSHAEMRSPISMTWTYYQVAMTGNSSRSGAPTTMPCWKASRVFRVYMRALALSLELSAPSSLTALASMIDCHGLIIWVEVGMF